MKDQIWPAKSVLHTGLPHWYLERAQPQEAWSHPGLCLVGDIHCWSQTWEVHPSPSKSTELKPPLGGYLNPKIEVSHREDIWVCQPLERQYTVQSLFSARSWGQTNGQKSGGSVFLSILNGFPSKESEGERKEGFEYPLLRKMSIYH